MSSPWVDKYKPQTINDIVGNENIIHRLRVISDNGNIPNMIICGSSGTGKTSSIHVLARKILGNSYKDGLLEISSSTYRDVDFIRNTVKNFSRKMTILPSGVHKIIIIEEAESLSSDSQQALKRIMEIHSKTTRFIFSCNSSSKIIEPLQSRCAVVRFSKLENEHIISRIVHICNKEGVEYTKEGIDAIVFTSDGDMRNAIGNLQATYTGMGVIDHENVFRLCDTPKPDIVLGIMRNCQAKEFVTAMNGVKSLKRDGHSSQDITNTFFKVCKVMSGVSEEDRMKMLKAISSSHIRILNGITSETQLVAMCSKFCSI